MIVAINHSITDIKANGIIMQVAASKMKKNNFSKNSDILFSF